MKKIDWSVIAKVLQKDASTDELRIFHEWLAASARHRRYMEKISRYDGHVPPLGSRELEDGLAGIRLKARNLRIRRLVRISGAAAASVLLVLGILFRFSASPEKEAFRTVALNALPEEVTLTRPDGRVQVLAAEKGGDKVREIVPEAAAPAPGNVRMCVVDVPRGRNWRLVLDDGTEVILNANSSFSFPEKMTSSGRRTVVLNHGEAYLKVKRDVSRPFVVLAGQTETRVLGTEFNVNAYRPECPETVLVNGSVEMGWKGSDEGVRIRPGQSVSPSDSRGFIVSQADVEAAIAWKDDIFLFKNASLGEITRRLGDWYDVEFQFTRQEQKQERCYCRLPKSSPLDTILQVLGKTVKGRYIHEGNKVIFF